MDADERTGIPSDPTPNPPVKTNEGKRVAQLKQQLAVGGYRVNADAVAREMLFKLRLASLSRRALVSYSTTHSVQPPARPHA
jgi:hypothetical protein